MEYKKIESLEDVVTLAEKAGATVRVVKDPYSKREVYKYTDGILYISVPSHRPLNGDEVMLTALEVSTRLWMDGLIQEEAVWGGWRIYLPTGEGFFIETPTLL